MTTVGLITEPIPTDDEAGLGCLLTERGNLPLTDVAVTARITGLLHRTSVRQTFSNPHDEPLEATYIFPLPDRAAVTSFRLTCGDRVVEGELQERAQARRAYDDAIAAGRVAAIAEQERSNVFTVRVGNLMPAAVAQVELDLTGPVALDAGEATWRFPLVVAPRYIPGQPAAGPAVGDGTEPDTDAVPDASRITPPVLLPGFPNPVRLSVRVEVDGAGLPVANLRSSLPADLADGGLTLRPGQRLDRDLLVRYEIATEEVGAALVAEDGTFALTVVPPVDRVAAGRPRDVVFVLDRSGSMMGWKMVAARRAVARMIDTLGPADRFAVLAFGNMVEAPAALTTLAAATDRHRFRGLEFLANLEARGGTEMLEPLQRAASVLAGDDDGRDRVLVLATDGQVGNEDQIVADLARRVAGIRIFTVGIDSAVNDGFLRRLAILGGGSCALVESEDRLDEVMERIHRRIGTPVLTDLRLAGDGLDIDLESLAPQRFGALYPGAALTIFGRHRGQAGGTIKITATDAADQPWSATVPVRPGVAETLAPAWARTRIRDLEDGYVVSPDPAVEKQLVDISLAAKVLCRFTAFVAVDVEVVNEGGQRRRITQPVDAPHGWAMFDAEVTRAGGAGYAMPMPLSPPAPAGPVPMARGWAVGLGFRAAPARPQRQAGKARPDAAPAFGMPAADGYAAAKEAVGLDLTRYRIRAQQLLASPSADPVARAALRRGLADLVQDLRSVGAGEDVLAPLVELLAAVQGRDWDGDVTALREFATAAGPTAGPRRAFWKR